MARPKPAEPREPPPTPPRPRSWPRSTRMGKAGTWSIGGHEVSLTNLDKVLFPERRADQARPHPLRRDDGAGLLPYLRDRGLNA